MVLPGKILKLGWEAVMPYPARLLDITVNDATVPSDRKRATVVPNYKKGDLSIVTNYRPVSLTSVVCRQMENIIAGYLSKSGIQINGYMKANMDSDRYTHVKAK
jgi:hypothetical protein